MTTPKRPLTWLLTEADLSIAPLKKSTPVKPPLHSTEEAYRAEIRKNLENIQTRKTRLEQRDIFGHVELFQMKGLNPKPYTIPQTTNPEPNVEDIEPEFRLGVLLEKRVAPYMESQGFVWTNKQGESGKPYDFEHSRVPLIADVKHSGFLTSPRQIIRSRREDRAWQKQIRLGGQVHIHVNKSPFRKWESPLNMMVFDYSNYGQDNTLDLIKRKQTDETKNVQLFKELKALTESMS